MDKDQSDMKKDVQELKQMFKMFSEQNNETLKKAKEI